MACGWPFVRWLAESVGKASEGVTDAAGL